MRPSRTKNIINGNKRTIFVIDELLFCFCFFSAAISFLFRAAAVSFAICLYKFHDWLLLSTIIVCCLPFCYGNLSRRYMTMMMIKGYRFHIILSFVHCFFVHLVGIFENGMSSISSQKKGSKSIAMDMYFGHWNAGQTVCAMLHILICNERVLRFTRDYLHKLNVS